MIQHKKNQESLGHMLQNGEACPFCKKYVVCSTDRAWKRADICRNNRKNDQTPQLQAVFFYKKRTDTEKTGRVQGL